MKYLPQTSDSAIQRLNNRGLVVSYPDLLSTNFQRQLLEINLRWLNKVLVVCEYMSFAKFWQVKNILMKNFD